MDFKCTCGGLTSGGGDLDLGGVKVGHLGEDDLVNRLSEALVQEAGAVLDKDLARLHLSPLGRQIQRGLHRKLIRKELFWTI